MKILITGAAGFIGSKAMMRLKQAGMDPVGLDNFADYYSKTIKRHNVSRLSEEGLKVVEGDLAEDDLAPRLEGVAGIIHFAAQPGLSAATPRKAYERNNVLATSRLLDAAEKIGTAPRIIYISTSSVYGKEASGPEDSPMDPASWYGETKLAAERDALSRFSENGLPVSALRIFSVYGERERPEKAFPLLIRSIDKELEFPIFEGSRNHRRSFTYVGDICDALLATFRNWDRAVGQAINIGSDQSFTSGEAFDTIERLMSKPALYKTLPPRHGDQLSTHACIEKARTLLGWEPKTSLHDGLARMVDWYRSEVRGSIDWK